MQRCIVAVLATVCLVAWPLPVSAQGAPFCRPGDPPAFTFGFAALKAQLGPIMGDPVECAHPNDANGDVLQKTTTGLSFWRKSTNTPTFTDGYRHWGLTPTGIVVWVGSAIDPPAMAGPGLAAFAGRWERRDASLFVSEGGEARAQWNTGLCIVQPPPCDRIVNGARVQGGLAEFSFTEVGLGQPPTARGQVMFTSDPGLFWPGPISLVLLANDLVLLEQVGNGTSLWWCRPPRNVNACGP